VSATRTFDAHAADYDALRRRLVPSYDALYGAAVEALRLLPRPPRRALDLGAGTGLLSRHIAAVHPDTELTLLDGAGAMLDEARAALGDRHAYVQADLRHPLPEGPFCAVVSALAIHHLEDADKRTLFARAHDALAPRGVFVNLEHVAGPTAALEERYARWHESTARALGATDEEWAGAEDRMRHDRCATVADQLDWLRAAGFDDADCVFKDHRFAVLVARRPG
jgi:tRNA (cmo5U34)-methyltransferase